VKWGSKRPLGNVTDRVAAGLAARVVEVRSSMVTIRQPS
jgi:hypothetical protein